MLRLYHWSPHVLNYNTVLLTCTSEVFMERAIVTCNIIPSTGSCLNELRSFVIVEGYDHYDI